MRYATVKVRFRAEFLARKLSRRAASDSRRVCVYGGLSTGRHLHTSMSALVVLPQTAKFRYIRRDGGATSPLPDGAALLPYITFAASRPHHLAHRESLCGVREGAPRGEERVEYLSHELRTSRVAPACAPCVSPEPSETLAVGVAGPSPVLQASKQASKQATAGRSYARGELITKKKWR